MAQRGSCGHGFHGNGFGHDDLEKAGIVVLRSEVEIAEKVAEINGIDQSDVVGGDEMPGAGFAKHGELLLHKGDIGEGLIAIIVDREAGIRIGI